MKRVRVKVTYQSFNFALSYIQDDSIVDVDLRAEKLPGSRPSDKKKLAYDRFVKGCKLYALHLPPTPITSTSAIDIADVIRLADSDEQLPVDNTRKISRPALTSSDVNLPIKGKSDSDIVPKKTSATVKKPLVKKVQIKPADFFERLANPAPNPYASIQPAKKRKAIDLPADSNAGKKVKISSPTPTADDSAIVNNKRKANDFPADDIAAKKVKISSPVPAPKDAAAVINDERKSVDDADAPPVRKIKFSDFVKAKASSTPKTPVTTPPKITITAPPKVEVTLPPPITTTTTTTTISRWAQEQKASHDREYDANFFARLYHQTGPTKTATAEFAAKAAIARAAAEQIAKDIAEEAAWEAGEEAAKQAAKEVDESRRDSAFDATFQVQADIGPTSNTSPISTAPSPTTNKTSLKRSRDDDHDDFTASNDTCPAAKRQRAHSRFSGFSNKTSSALVTDNKAPRSPTHDRSKTREPAFAYTAPTPTRQRKTTSQQAQSDFDAKKQAASEIVADINQQIADKRAAEVAKAQKAKAKAEDRISYQPTHKEQGRRDGKSRRRYTEPTVWSIAAGERRREQEERREIDNDSFLQRVNKKSLKPETPHR